jgi:hypothetical protein
MNKIIGLCGFIGSGKGTVAKILVEQYGYAEESFASTLKDAVAAVFGWPRHMLEGDTDASRHWREQPDEWWSRKLGNEITPRFILQYWGTNVCRQNFHPDIWILSLERKLADSDKPVVVADCRFFNEVDMIKRMGGEVWRVRRGEEPEWYNDAYLLSTRNDQAALSKLEQRNIHPSEYSWVGADFDRVLYNDNTIDQLKAVVAEIATL